MKHQPSVFFFQAEDGIRDVAVTGVQTCALPIFPRGLVMLAALVALLAVLLASRRRGARDARAALPTFYARALRTLARRGLRPGDGETAREFAQRVEAAVPPCAEPLARLTTAYEQVRFGIRPLTMEEATMIERSVLELRSRVAPFSGDRKSTRLNSSHGYISYAVFCLKKKKKKHEAYIVEQ